VTVTDIIGHSDSGNSGHDDEALVTAFPAVTPERHRPEARPRQVSRPQLHMKEPTGPAPT